MSRSKAIAVLFYLGALIVGAAVGIAVDRRLVQGHLETMAQDPRNMRERFFTDLRFTPEQRAAWDSIRGATQRADSVLLAPIAAKRDSLREATNASRRALLTKEQLKKLDELQARRPRPNDGRR
jgi:hypothetical protein